MQNKRTILFFTDTYNTAVAENINNELLSYDDVASVIITKKELKSKLYRFFIKKVFPQGSSAYIYAMNKRIAYKSNGLNSKKAKSGIFATNNRIQKRILNALHRYNPGVAVVTEQSVLPDLLSAVDKYGKELTVAVVSDEYILDKRLISNAVSVYIVDNLDMSNGLSDNGVPNEKIFVYRLPIDKKFIKERDVEGAKVKFLLNENLPTVLVSGSRVGDKRFFDVLDELNGKFNANFIVACGKNRKLLNYARNLGFSAYNDGIDINSALNACDLVISRPTTMLLTEALAKGKTVFSLFPNGKMEKATLDYLGVDGIVKIDSIDELVQKLKKYIEAYTYANVKGNTVNNDCLKTTASAIAEKLVSLTKKE